MDLRKNIAQTLDFLQTKKRILFLTTSNRWSGEKGGEKPKSTLLAEKIAEKLGAFSTGIQITIIDVPKLKIYPCEGNVSTQKGNSCGLLEAMLKNPDFNPSGYHRCWASINNPDDELWKISKELFQSDTIVFFGSIRWGQTNSYYQKLIERLTWIENRHATLGENNIVGEIAAGCIFVGHNWRGKEVVETQKEVLKFFGFNVKNELCWNYQYSIDSLNESVAGYTKDAEDFRNFIQKLS